MRLPVEFKIESEYIKKEVKKEQITQKHKKDNFLTTQIFYSYPAFNRDKPDFVFDFFFFFNFPNKQ